MDEYVTVLNKHIPSLKEPQQHDLVYNNECMYSFDSPYTHTGLYVCMNTFYGLGKEHLLNYHLKTGSSVYVHLKYNKILVERSEPVLKESQNTACTIIGAENRSLSKKFETKKSYSVVILPEFFEIALPNDNLPAKVNRCAYAIINAESFNKSIKVRTITKHMNLNQMPLLKKWPQHSWKCEKCEASSDLWLNLTDGAILCSRKSLDGRDIHDHSKKHFFETGYPLVVKLGCEDDHIDVFSYDEDEMVNNPNLEIHLAHFGITVFDITKKHKSIIECESKSIKTSGELEAAEEIKTDYNLKTLLGPDCKGLNDLRSYYLPCCVRLLLNIPGFLEKFIIGAPEIFKNADGDPALDFNVQMTKFSIGLLSGKRVRHQVDDCDNSSTISTCMFTHMLDKRYPTIMLNHNGDVGEFLLYLLNTIKRNSVSQPMDPTRCFYFKLEEINESRTTSKVEYKYRTTNCLTLNVSEKLAENAASGNEGAFIQTVRPRISLQSCIQTFVSSSACEKENESIRTTRLCNFPEFLIIVLKKVRNREYQTPVELDPMIEVPTTIDISTLKSKTIQPEEELSLPSPNKETVDSVNLNELLKIGFTFDDSKRALTATRKKYLDIAIDWLKSNEKDPVRKEPIALETSSASKEEYLYRLKAFVSHLEPTPSSGNFICHINEKNKWMTYNDEKITLSENPPNVDGNIYIFEKL